MTSPFTGTWKIDPEKSRAWDLEQGEWVSPDPIGLEVVRMFITDKIFDQEIVAGLNPTLRMTISAEWDGEWVPYMVHDVKYPESAGTGVPTMGLKHDANHAIGQPFGWVKMMYVTEGFHYRLSKSADGESPAYVMSRSMHDDENSYTATVMNSDGKVVLQRYFDRQ